MKNKKWMMIVLALFVLSGLAIYYVIDLHRANKTPAAPSGIILGQYVTDYRSSKKDLLLVDTDGHVRWLARITGTSSWSMDGTKIAAGCEDDENALCIFDTATIPDYSKFPPSASPEIMQIEKKINLPERCHAIMTTLDTYSYDRILSITWAPSGEQLAVVCGDPHPDKMRDVCVINTQTGDERCWENSLSQTITNISWSPRENLLAVGGNPAQDAEITLAGIDGTVNHVLTNGWSPEWSPDGKRIAYIRYIPSEEGNGDHQIRIGIIDKGGKNNRWLYDSSSAKSLLEALFLDYCNYNYGACRLSWSPDGKYLVFVSSTGSAYNYNLFRMDVRTGEIVRLLDPRIIGNQIVEPDWGY